MKQPVAKSKSWVTCDAVHACIEEKRGGWRGIEPSMLNTSSSPRYSVMSWSMYLHTTVRFFEPLAVEKVGASAVTSQLNLPETAKLTSRRVTWLLFEFSSWNRATCVCAKWMQMDVSVVALSPRYRENVGGIKDKYIYVDRLELNFTVKFRFWLFDTSCFLLFSFSRCRSKLNEGSFGLYLSLFWNGRNIGQLFAVSVDRVMILNDGRTVRVFVLSISDWMKFV